MPGLLSSFVFFVLFVVHQPNATARVHSLNPRFATSFMTDPSNRIPAEAAAVVLAIHGGLACPRERLSADREEAVRAAMQVALQKGFEVLQSGTAESVAAVLAAVEVMEDSPEFNAGRGSVFTQTGSIEMDAALMEGATRQAGAVAHVKRIRNPIRAAQAVLMQSPAVFLVGAEADQFAQQRGLPIEDPSYFFTDRRHAEFLAWKENPCSVLGEGSSPQDRQVNLEKSAAYSRGTVGAVARDRAGNLAAATSTGGVSLKIPGRVGDSGVLGAGTFADNRTCAVSCTGDGELFIRSSAAYSVSARMMFGGQGLRQAAQAAIDDIRALGGLGGLVAIDLVGNVALPYHGPGLFRGTIDERGVATVALYED